MRTSIKIKLAACCISACGGAAAQSTVIPQNVPHPAKTYYYVLGIDEGKIIVGDNPLSDEWRCTIIGLDGKPLLEGEYGEIIGPDEYGYYSVKGTDGSQMWLTKDLQLIKEEKHPSKPYELKQKSDNEVYILDSKGKHKLQMPENCYAEWLTEERIIYCEIKELPSNDVDNDFPSTELRYGVMDMQGNITVPAQYAKIYPYSEGVAMASMDNVLWGGIDNKGNTVIPFSLYIPVSATAHYDAIWGFNDGLITVSNMSEPDTYDEDTPTEKLGYADKTGRIVISNQYEYADVFKNGVANVSDDCVHYYYIDKKGNKTATPADRITIDPVHEEAGPRNYKIKYVSSEGLEVLPPIYDDGMCFNGEYALVKIGENWHLIDRTGKFILRDIATEHYVYPG